MNQPEHSSEKRNGVTVTQYQGPTIRFESPEEYAKWLFNDGRDDPDHALVIDITANWDDPSREQENQDAMDEMITRAEREMRHSR